MNELALFAGAGGGILGGHLLGWRTICAVERDAYAAQVLAQRQTEHSRLSQFGLTYAALTDDRGEDLLMWYQENFLAKTFPQLDLEWESKDHAHASGNRWLESSARYDPLSSSWKTHHCLFIEDLPWSSVILPRWGMTRSGYVYRHPNSERHMNAIAPGWLGETFPTPTAAMSKGSSNKALTRVDGRSRLRNRLDYWVERDGKNGRLNPEFVEWIMGWPIGWTALKPLATGRYHEWRRQHSPSSLKLDEVA